MPAFQIGKIPPRLKGPTICLDLLKPWSWPALYRLFKKSDKDCLECIGFLNNTSPLRMLLFSLYRFNWAYLIEANQTPVGIAGIYSFEPRCSLFLALAVLDGSHRAMGIGSECVEILTNSFKKMGLCKEVWVEVLKNNKRGFNFWIKNGFTLEYKTAKGLIMKKNL